MKYKHLYFNSGSLKLDSAKCIACGRCLEVCPHKVFVLNSSLVSIERPELCMECGACKKNCPTSAIEVDRGVGCASLMISRFVSSDPDCECDCC